MDVIIGAGLSGLTSGIDLVKMERDVIVLEKEAHVGGLAASRTLPDGYVHDIGFHVIIPDAIPLFEMVRKSGIEKDLIHFDMKFGFMKNRKIYPFSPNPVSLAKFQLLEAKEKLKLGMLIHNIDNLKEEDFRQMSARTFIIEKIGDNAYQSFYEPLLTRLSGISPEELSSVFFISFCKLLGKVKNYSLCYPRKGIGELSNGLAAYLESMNGNIRTECEVRKITIHNDRVKSVIYSNNGKEKEIDASNVVSTIPLNKLPDIIELPVDFRKRLKDIKYSQFNIAYFGLNNRLTDYDMEVMIPKNEGFCFNSFTEVSNISNEVAPKGKSLMSIVAAQHIVNGNEEQVLGRITEDMNQLFPGFVKKIIWSKLMRYPYPSVTGEYLSLKPDFTSPVKGLYLGGAQMFPIPDMPTAIVSGHIISNMIQGA